ALGELQPATGQSKADLAGRITLAPPSTIGSGDLWTRRFPDPVSAFASGWMRVRARARQGGIELPLVISDHADWDGLCATIEATDPDPGYALAAMTSALSFKHAKASLIRDLITARTDPVLFGYSYDYVGDLSETVALMWPKAAALTNNPPPPTLTEVVTTLDT